MEGDEGRWKGQEEAVEGNGGRQENQRGVGMTNNTSALRQCCVSRCRRDN